MLRVLFQSQVPRGYNKDMFGTASSPVVRHRGAGRPSAALKWPVCQQRPRPAAVALACSTAWRQNCSMSRHLSVTLLGRVYIFLLPVVVAGRCDLATQRECEASLAVCCEVQLLGPYVRTASDAINQVSRNSLISYWGEAARETQPTHAALAKKILAIAPIYVAIRLHWAGFPALLFPMSVSFLFIITLLAKCKMNEEYILVIHCLPYDKNKHLRNTES